ncbi:MAG: putative 2-aminoethylphosphonate ABC transporter ATP-binding protein [Ferrovibrio sp.]|uniref:putative 2-aminoethylphosphonate ABC transporter ATP-binding protein n=1 Tax=Ferrovibrio sp. TaxID=1917215 RepID=UPI00391987C2
MTQTPYLRVDRLTKRFGSFTALRDISLSIEEGEFVCFLGPSGCGKTTLLRAIAGLDPQDEGRIWRGDTDISQLPAGQRDYGIVFQSYALFPNLTAAQNIGYGLKALSRREKDARVAELLALIGMPEIGTKYPSQLSGGQQQRVALARALAPSPGLLLLDEPLSALDARVRQNLRHEIVALQERLGITTIMVTHDQEEALTMADRIVVMNQGVIEQIGTPAEIYRRPATAFVAEFIGSMNFWRGHMVDAGKAQLGSLCLTVNGHANGMTRGSHLTVCIRPEDVVVRNLLPDAANRIQAQVDDMEFMGSFFRSELRAGDGEGVRLRADFSTNAVADLNIKPGSRIEIALPPERLICFHGSH